MRPPVPALERFPEFHRPLPVDSVVLGACKPGPTVPPGLGVNMRFHVGVLDYYRGDYVLEDYARTPWASVRAEWKQRLLTAFLNFAGANGFVTVPGVQIPTNNITLYGPDDTAQHKSDFYNNTDNQPNDRLGNPCLGLGYTGTFASSGFFTPNYEFAAATPVYDDVALKITTSGSVVHTDPAMNISNIFCNQRLRYQGIAQNDQDPIPVDNTISGGGVATGKTVTVNMTVQF